MTPTTDSYRAYSPGANQPLVPAAVIESDARFAASIGLTLTDACRYPLRSEAGQHFTAVFYLARHTPASAKVLTTSAANINATP